ncbi:lanthionine synthetase LanC family protein [Streptosporangium sp. NPDC051023]|uniref:lanthionine synthetase LanC family protein n=1 Tax=Streptosporangium sp. NPDC051023 TaxID=3155410 RepID=UPI003450CAF3
MNPFVESAMAIAHRLAEEALPAPSGVRWQGATVTGTEENPRIEHGDTGVDLYSGAAGIGLFLGHASRYDETGRLARLSREAITHALSQARALAETGRLGLYDGVTGVAVAALSVGLRLSDAELVTASAELARAVAREPADVAGELGPDLIGGVAGIVLGLLHIYRHTGCPELLTAAVAAARELAACASAEPWGSSWGLWDSGEGGPNLTGLAHGTAGVALALQEAGTLADDLPLLETAVAAMRYERGWYAVAHRNWPDLRRSATRDGHRPAYPIFWCHGAVGIGLARLRAYQLTGDTLALAEASAAIQATRDLTVRVGTALRREEPADMSLCHGLAGAAELFLTAARVLNNGDHLRAARNVGHIMLGHRDLADGWPCGIAGAGEVPDLLLGLAGIGLTMLRLHEPDATMSASPTGWS